MLRFVEFDFRRSTARHTVKQSADQSSEDKLDREAQQSILPLFLVLPQSQFEHGLSQILRHISIDDFTRDWIYRLNITFLKTSLRPLYAGR